MLIESRPNNDPELAALVAAQQAELRAAERAGRIASGVVQSVRENARHVVGVLGGRVVGCGALQALDAETAEIRRMYVRPAYRGRGLGRQLLLALEEMAMTFGYTVLRLETTRYLTHALRLYGSCGYVEIPPCGGQADNPYRVCFQKRLLVPA